MEEVFTTGQIAKLCMVASRTAAKWIDRGMLKGWRLPGSNDRRVSRSAFIAFLDKYQMPTLEELQGQAAERGELTDRQFEFAKNEGGQATA